MRLVAPLWLALLTALVAWQILGTSAWESKDEIRSLLCEDALTRRRESELALARMGSVRPPTVVDAKRLSDALDEARADIQRYCS